MTLYTAIIIGHQFGHKFAAKYRNINSQEKFLSYVQKAWTPKGAEAVNFYEKKTRQFVNQVKIKSQP